MHSYDIAEEGYHSPLTAAQVSELFYAGRLQRNSPCRVRGRTPWRTVDEIFPLLKYNSSAQWHPPSTEKSQRPAFARSELAFALAGTLVGGLAVAIYFASGGRAMPLPPKARVTAIRGIPSPQNSVSPAWASFSPRTTTNNIPISQPNSFYGAIPQPAAAPPDHSIEDARRRAEEERKRREQVQREQAALSDRLRNEQRARDEARERAKGTNHIIPLDSYSTVPVGSSTVRVKIHDNDVTSFDVWIDGSWRHEVKKEKGITGSGTDETLIYASGKARLYYVWEISGRLNSCQLRVRTD